MLIRIDGRSSQKHWDPDFFVNYLFIIKTMKFMKYILIIFSFIQLVELRNFRSQASRNYRKIHTDPSYNPIPDNHNTGGRNINLNLQSTDKYIPYSRKLSHEHSYKDRTNEMKSLANSRNAAAAFFR
jgi:hypothetical protein